MDKKEALSALGGLSQESRLDIFRLLVQHGSQGVPAGEIACRLGIANATLSFHLKELTRAGLITGRQQGRYVYYAANFETINGLVRYVTENCCGSTCDIGCVPNAKPNRRAA